MSLGRVQLGGPEGLMVREQLEEDPAVSELHLQESHRALLHFHFLLSCIREGNGNPLQCSCLENPRDGGA